MARGRARLRHPSIGICLVLAVGILLSGIPGASGSPPPVLPVADGARAVSNITAPSLAPGSAGSISLDVLDPLPSPIASVVLTLEVYAFNAYPGNATGAVPPAAVEFAAANGATLNGTGSELQYRWNSLDPGASVGVEAPFDTQSGAPQGTYAVRTSLEFIAGNLTYRFESRGYFSAAVWDAATALPGGGSTLNLSQLAVSGVLPETAVLVHTDAFAPWIYLLLVGALGLAAAGGYFAVRDGPGSSSGATRAPEESSAPRAAGKRRTRDGD